MLSGISRFAARTFYRLENAGEAVPSTGPVLLVANHPNSLLDPALVVAAAGRPVRFLAKAPLFADPKIAWLVRGAGSIPVYRRDDDPSATGRNDEMFRAVHAALADGCAVGIFPEGLSHSEPTLAPLKTGAARIALGAAAILGRTIPIVPVGLSYRDKQRFRSEALALVGPPVEWDDLAAPDTVDAVRELTRRIDAAMRGTTVDLERWEDAPLIEWAEQIFVAELGGDPGAASRVARQREAAEALARMRRAGERAWIAVARDVARHGRLLTSLGLKPGDLGRAQRTSTALRWSVMQLAYFLVGAPLAIAGTATFVVPYRLTGWVHDRLGPELDRRSTYKALYGSLIHMAWILALTGIAAWSLGVVGALVALVALPSLALVTVAVRDRWRYVQADARRFMLLRDRRTLQERLRTRQRDLAFRLQALHGASMAHANVPKAEG